MKRRLKITAAVLSALAVLAVAWVYRPYSKPDLARVHPRVRQLQEPLRSVHVGYYLDGGSISLHLIDAKGTELELAVPVWADGQEYGAIYLDTKYQDTNSPGLKIADAEHTAFRLQEVLRQSRPPDIMKDLAASRWSGRTRDSVRLLIRKFSGQYPKEE